MICPKCYGSVDKHTKRCKSCGFNMNSINGATHKAVKQAKKEGFGEDVIYTNNLPDDISRKKLILLTCFLGIFGGHSYYCGKLFKAIYSTVISTIMIVFSILRLSNVLTLDVAVLNWSFSIITFLMGVNLVMFIVDLVKILTKKYKVSVYKDSFSN